MSQRKKRGHRRNVRRKPTRQDLTRRNIQKSAARRDSGRRSGGRRGIVASAAIAAVAVVLILSMSQGFIATEESPSSADDPAETDASAPSEEDQEPAVSLPRRLVVPAMGVNTRLVGLDRQKNKDAVQLPPEKRAGWYKESVRPGAAGVAVIVGYIDASPTNPGVFTRLAQLKKSDKITVRSADGARQVFTVSEIATYAEGELPTNKVYGGTEEPELRLITSGGKLRDKDPRGNVVVYARLVDSR